MNKVEAVMFFDNGTRKSRGHHAVDDRLSIELRDHCHRARATVPVSKYATSRSVSCSQLSFTNKAMADFAVNVEIVS